jgi:polar amino acid transport system permease protein
VSAVKELIPPQPAPPAALIRWSPARFLGVALLGLWIVGGIGLVVWLIDAWDMDKVETYGPKYLSGLATTLTLVAISITLGAALSVPIAFGRMSSNRILSSLAYGYVYFFRGTPLIAQLFLIYYGFGSFREELQAIGLWVFFRDAWNCALFAFTLNTAAYQAEILRGAIESVARGQHEGASALGLNRFQAFYRRGGAGLPGKRCASTPRIIAGRRCGWRRWGAATRPTSRRRPMWRRCSTSTPRSSTACWWTSSAIMCR